MTPVSEYGAIPDFFPVDECPTPEFHLPTRLCGNCKWAPYMHPDFVPRYDYEVEQLREWRARTDERVCENCGNDVAVEGYPFCVDCLKEAGDGL